ncbi:MAG: hypothetical protein KC933_29575 [Myxococcales bacterium]|nr:hypothetical protein [Myxococcales bacterium]
MVDVQGDVGEQAVVHRLVEEAGVLLADLLEREAPDEALRPIRLAQRLPDLARALHLLGEEDVGHVAQEAHQVHRRPLGEVVVLADDGEHVLQLAPPDLEDAHRGRHHRVAHAELDRRPGR